MTNIKQAAKNAAFAVGMFVFPVQPKQTEETFDIDEHIAKLQASFRAAVKDDLK
jgi:hypothetical protein